MEHVTPFSFSDFICTPFSVSWTTYTPLTPYFFKSLSVDPLPPSSELLVTQVPENRNPDEPE